MKAFFLGLFFLIAAGLLLGIGTLLAPLILVLAFFLQIIIWIALVFFGIWLLGKLIIFVWESLK